MHTSIQALCLAAASGLLSGSAQAQPAPKIVIVDMAKLFDNHYETQAEKTKLEEAGKKAQDQIDQMNKEGNALIAQYKDLDEQAKNPAANTEAKAKAATDAQKKGQEIQAKMQDINTFANNAKATIQQRIQTFRGMMMEDISKVVVQVAKRHDATLVLDKSGPSLLGIPAVIFCDSAYDITDEVMGEINKGRPIGTPSVAPSAPAAPAAAAPAAGMPLPKITVPGVTAPSK